MWERKCHRKMQISTLESLNTKYPLDSVEWCNHPHFLEYFVCGMYNLVEGEQETSTKCRRDGSICLYKYDFDEKKLSKSFQIETSAVLDMKWMYSRDADKPILLVANAEGFVELYTLHNEELSKCASAQIDDNSKDLLTLSLDYHDSPRKRVATSDSKGNVTIFNIRDQGLEKECSWNAHSFEAWTCTFDKWNTNVVYTGGDDAKMNVYEIEKGVACKLKQNTIHTAGVTSLLSHPQKENLLITGSYDEIIRLFDTRSLKRELCSLNLKGGIWRLKPNSKHTNYILCACMYHNFSVVEFNEDLNAVQLLAEYNEHENICYGADWCQSLQRRDYLVLATCSFYDKKLCISELQTNNC